MMTNMKYIPNELLSRLVGARLYSVEFVLNEYVQFRFDGLPGDITANPVTINSYVWPTIEFGGRNWRENETGYADALRKLIPGTVVSTREQTGAGLWIVFDTGAIVIHPLRSEVYVEIAMIQGFTDGCWMVWRPGEESFEDLA